MKRTRAIVGAVVAMSLMANAVMAQQAGAGKPQRKSSETRDPVVPARGAVTDVWVVFKTHFDEWGQSTRIDIFLALLMFRVQFSAWPANLDFSMPVRYIT